MVPHRVPSKIPLLSCKVASRNDDFDYETCHTAFTMHQSDSSEPHATEMNDPAITDPMPIVDGVCEGCKQEGDSEPKTEVHFSEIVQQAQAIQAAKLKCIPR